MDNHIKTLGLREKYRDDYFLTKDPIFNDRLLWRAQSFRHLVHLLPGQTILELGAGRGLFTYQLLKISREENPITSLSFSSEFSFPKELNSKVEYLCISDIPNGILNRQFDFIVAMDLLDRRNCSWFLQKVYDLLKPTGQLVFYESNPWNLYLKLRRLTSRILRKTDPRHLLSRTDLYELMSEIGYIKIFALTNRLFF